MGRNKFIAEFPINASKKMLYPYIFTASGLSQWFADDVNVNEDHVFNFIINLKNYNFCLKLIIESKSSRAKYIYLSFF